MEKVIPLENYSLMGTDIKLSKGVATMAIDATNQPNWRSKGLKFVYEAGVTDLESDRNMLLKKEDYVSC